MHRIRSADSCLQGCAHGWASSSAGSVENNKEASHIASLIVLFGLSPVGAARVQSDKVWATLSHCRRRLHLHFTVKWLRYLFAAEGFEPKCDDLNFACMFIGVVFNVRPVSWFEACLLLEGSGPDPQPIGQNNRSCNILSVLGCLGVVCGAGLQKSTVVGSAWSSTCKVIGLLSMFGVISHLLAFLLPCCGVMFYQ